ncbi:MAG: thermitase [Lentimonas sp.]|jgi:thermitase
MFAKSKFLTVTVSLLLLITSAYILLRQTDSPEHRNSIESVQTSSVQPARLITRTLHPLDNADDAESLFAEAPHAADSVALIVPENAIPGELLVYIADQQALERYAQDAVRQGARILRYDKRLGTLRLAYGDDKSLANKLLSSLPQDGQADFNYIISLPDLPLVQAGQEMASFDGNVLSWLGLEGDHSQFGSGVTIAVIDSGVQPHRSFSGRAIKQISLISEGEASYHEYSAHGTAVTSIITGNGDVNGLSPAANIYSFQVLNADGVGDVYALSQAIVGAADRGAQVINLSLGTYSDSFLLQKAVNYALSKNVVLVAAAGNDGLTLLPYPAAYAGVIAVGAVDANGIEAYFSNSGNDVDILAPGVDIHSAWSNNQLVLFSGTSAATPFVSAAIAAILSQNPTFSTQQAVAFLLDNATVYQSENKASQTILNLQILNN